MEAKRPEEATGRDKELLEHLEAIREAIHEQTHQLYQLADEMAAEDIMVALQPGDCPACMFIAAILAEAYMLRAFNSQTPTQVPMIKESGTLPSLVHPEHSELH